MLSNKTRREACKGDTAEQLFPFASLVFLEFFFPNLLAPCPFYLQCILLLLLLLLQLLLLVMLIPNNNNNDVLMSDCKFFFLAFTLPILSLSQLCRGRGRKGRKKEGRKKGEGGSGCIVLSCLLRLNYNSYVYHKCLQFAYFPSKQVSLSGFMPPLSQNEIFCTSGPLSPKS